MVYLVSQFVLIFFGLIGLMVFASSELPMATREIAMNTRKDPSQGSSYVMIKVLSICLKVMAVLLWVVGVGLWAAMLLGGPSLGGLFEAAQVSSGS